MDLEYAYKLVLNDLIECAMFTGRYDARHGKEDFMYGIQTVMESIAYHISDEVGDEFNTKFVQNMIESEERAKNESY